MEETSFVSLNARIKHEDKRRHSRFSDCEIWRWSDIITSIEQFRASLTIQTFSEFVYLAEIVGRNIDLKVAHVTHSLSTILDPRKVWVNVCLASCATERTLFSKVNQGDFTCALSVIMLSWLSKWLYHETKWHSTLLLHFMVYWGLHCCCPQIAWCTLSFVNGDLWYCGRRWKLSWSSTVLYCKAWACFERIYSSEGTRQHIFWRRLAFTSLTLLSCKSIILQLNNPIQTFRLTYLETKSLACVANQANHDPMLT